MARRKTHKKIAAGEMRRQIIARVDELCEQSRTGIAFYRRGPAYHEEMVTVIGVIVRMVGGYPKFQKWDYVGHADLMLWLARLDAGGVRPMNPIPALELLAREAE